MDKSKSFDPITLEVMRNAFYSIADEMIVALIRASYSTNIKDRRDTSCAIYTATGDVVVVAQSVMLFCYSKLFLLDGVVILE